MISGWYEIFGPAAMNTYISIHVQMRPHMTKQDIQLDVNVNHTTLFIKFFCARLAFPPASCLCTRLNYICWMLIAYMKFISLLSSDLISSHICSWTLLLMLYAFLMTHLYFSAISLFLADTDVLLMTFHVLSKGQERVCAILAPSIVRMWYVCCFLIYLPVII